MYTYNSLFRIFDKSKALHKSLLKELFFFKFVFEIDCNVTLLF